MINEAEKWLELIRRHLTENLLMEKEDIDYLPIFTREGGSWAKLTRSSGVNWKGSSAKSTEPLQLDFWVDRICRMDRQ